MVERNKLFELETDLFGTKMNRVLQKFICKRKGELESGIQKYWL